MEYASGLIKLKPGSEAKVAEWRSTVASRPEEVAATHRDEEVQIESWFTIEIGGEKYLLWYLRQVDSTRVRSFPKAQTSDRQIPLRTDGADHGGQYHCQAADRYNA